MTQTIKSLPINVIKPITKGKKGFAGGLEDLGNFKEGFCFKIVLSNGEEWIMCCDSLDEKEEWMDAIVLVKGLMTTITTSAVLEGQITIPPNAPVFLDNIEYQQTGPDGEEIDTVIGPPARPR